MARFEEAAHFAGAVTFGSTVTLPAGTVKDASVEAGTGIAATKSEHQFSVTVVQTGAAADLTSIAHAVYGATCTVIGVKAGSVTIGVGAGACSVDVLKNGTTILTAPIVLDSGNTAYIPEDGTISVAAGVADDVYTVTFDETAGGGTSPTGVYCTITFQEDAA